MTDPFDDLAAVWRKQPPKEADLVRPSAAEDALARLSAQRDRIGNARVATVGMFLLAVQVLGLAGVPMGADQTLATLKAPLLVADLALDLAVAVCWARRLGAERRLATAAGSVRDTLQVGLDATDREKRDLLFLIGGGGGIQVLFLAYALLGPAGHTLNRVGPLLVALSPVAAFLTLAIPAFWYLRRVLPDHRHHLSSLLEELAGR